ncbi:MerR family transcriptional regulator [Enterococcus sp. UD-01]|jgi:DNA-binding transcriptional MerR regulator|uniref:MerR family transcriptional regulator n=1 Tax=Enterococcus sp. UD-01 TaxID=3373911 RepID=UPI0038344225
MIIKEMSERVGLSADTLRYYERIGVIPAVPRTEYGVRTYSEVHLEWIESILKLKASGMTLEMIIEYVRLANIGDTTIEARKNLLEEERERISEKIFALKQRQSMIDLKIKDYYEDLLPKTTAMIKKMNAAFNE